MKKHYFGFAIISTLLTLNATNVSADTLQVACASDFVSTLEKIAKSYEATHHTKITITQGASGALTNQIINGFPADIFFSADQSHPDYLVKTQHAKKTFLYATGEVILVTMPAKNSVKYDSAQSFLTQTPTMKISIANPKIAPYGKHSLLILKDMHLWHQWAPKIVYGENIGVTFSYFLTGNVSAAFVAKSEVNQYKNSHPTAFQRMVIYAFSDKNRLIPQYGVVLNNSSHAQSAASFVNYVLHSAQANKILKEMGYSEKSN